MKPYVLVAEDNQIECLRLTSILEAAGFIPIVVNEGYTALKTCEKYQIDAALIDIQMPHMNGFDFVQSLVKMKGQVPFPIIMMTATRHETKHIKSAIDLGAKDFLVKPTDPEIVTSKLRALLKNKEEWSERLINETQMPRSATVNFGIQMQSISEMGIRISSSMPMETNKFIELNWPVFQSFGLGPLNLKVVECEKKDQAYSIYLTFLGVPENQLKILRQICLKVSLSEKFIEQN